MKLELHSEKYSYLANTYINLVLSSKLIKLELPPRNIRKADVWSVNPLSESIPFLCPVNPIKERMNRPCHQH